MHRENPALSLTIKQEDWEITNTQRALFPGGPRAYRVSSPYGSFLFGMTCAHESAHQIATVSSFGRVDFKTAEDIFAGEMHKRVDAQKHVSELLIQKGAVFTGSDPISQVVYSEASEMSIEIF